MGSVLDSIRLQLLAIPSEDIRAPDQPVDVYLQETADLLEHIAENKLATVLVDEGLEQETLDGIPPALAAAREAQTEWNLTNDRSKSQEQKDAEKRGYTLRTKVAKKARFALRRNGAALAVLAQILEGEGLADLVQDLDDLNMLLTHHAHLFARNKNFDAAKASAELTTTAVTIRAGLSGFRMNPEQSKAVDLRNRAWTHLDELVDDIREAGRAATEGTIARGFSSAYERRKRAASRRKSQSTVGPQS